MYAHNQFKSWALRNFLFYWSLKYLTLHYNHGQSVAKRCYFDARSFHKLGAELSNCWQRAKLIKGWGQGFKGGLMSESPTIIKL
jgi:hypothetical protein